MTDLDIELIEDRANQLENGDLSPDGAAIVMRATAKQLTALVTERDEVQATLDMCIAQRDRREDRIQVLETVLTDVQGTLLAVKASPSFSPWFYEGRKQDPHGVSKLHERVLKALVRPSDTSG